MDIHSEHHEANIRSQGIFFETLRNAQRLIQGLIRMITITEQDLDEAGVNLGKM